jgi:hypothetical protein
MERNEIIYSLIFVFSLLLFLLNYLLQAPLSFGYSDSFGLIGKMGIVFWIGCLGMLILIYYHFSNFEKIGEKYILLSFCLVIIYLVGPPIFYEFLPRFEDSWTHSYLATRIYEAKKVFSTENDYEQYPGSFLFYGLLFEFIPIYMIIFNSPAEKDVKYSDQE